MISEKDLKDEQVLVESLYLSLDPAMRGWLNGTSSLYPSFPILPSILLLRSTPTLSRDID